MLHQGSLLLVTVHEAINVLSCSLILILYRNSKNRQPKCTAQCNKNNLSAQRKISLSHKWGNGAMQSLQGKWPLPWIALGTLLWPLLLCVGTSLLRKIFRAWISGLLWTVLTTYVATLACAPEKAFLLVQ